MATESVIPGDLPPLIRYRWVRLFVAIMSAGTAIVTLLWLMSIPSWPPPARAAGTQRYVAPGGIDSSNDCTENSNPCATVQHAVDVAISGDEILVASGTYTDVNFNAGSISTQTVYINKTLTLGGGYTRANWTNPDPEANQTVLDAGGRGRVIYIAGSASPTIIGFIIQNGSAATDNGGGIFIQSGTPLIAANTILSSTASHGGGIYNNGGSPRLKANIISSNTAVNGGGFFSDGGIPTTLNNVFRDNRAVSGGWGGGLANNISSTVVVQNDVFYHNTAASGGGLVNAGTLLVTNAIIFSNTANTSGGALYNYSGSTVIDHSDVVGNTGGDYFTSTGRITVTDSISVDPLFQDAPRGDFHLQAGSPARDAGTTLSDLSDDFDGQARPFGPDYDMGADEYYPDSSCFARLDNGRVYASVQVALDDGSAGSLVQVAGHCSDVELRGGEMQVAYIDKALTLQGGYAVTDWIHPRYRTTLDAHGAGRAVYATGTGAVTIENLHLTGGQVDGDGAGVYLGPDVNATLQNNVIYANQANNSYGGGVYDAGGNALLQHNTLYNNTASGGGGVYAGGSGVVTLRNNILANNTAISLGGGGIFASSGDNFSLDYNDFYGNDPGPYGGSVPGLGPHDVALPPGFVDAAGGDFHLDYLTSQVINQADPASTLATDFEGEPRPQGARADIGADESAFYAEVTLSDAPESPYVVADPDLVRGRSITFTHTIANLGHTGAATDTFVIETSNGTGWEVILDGISSPVMIASGDSRTFRVVVRVPVTAPDLIYNQTSITATSQTNAAALDTAQDTIVSAGVALVPSYNENVDPGEAITYTHVLTNIGPVPDTYSINLISDRSPAWGDLTVSWPFTVTLNPNQSIQITTVVSVPLSAEAGLAEHLKLVATSNTYPGVSATVTDTTTANAIYGDRYVSTVGQDTINNCHDPARPCRTIKRGLEQVTVNSTVFVARGTYDEHDLSILKTILLQGGWDNTFKNHDWRPESTVIDAGQSGRVLQIGGAPTIEYFTLRGGQRLGGSGGGGVYLEATAAPTLRRNIIRDNRATNGGGLYNNGGTPILHHNRIFNNQADTSGGGIYNSTGTLVVSATRVYSNTAGQRGGALASAGGTLLAQNDFIYGNHAGDGGAIYVGGGLATIQFDSLYHNTASGVGGGILVAGDTIYINNTIVFSHTGAGIYRSGGTVSHDYNDVYQNSGGDYVGLGAASHDLATDPLFVNAPGGNLHLDLNSPGVDRGDPASTLGVDIDGDDRPVNQGFDIGADELTGCLAKVMSSGTVYSLLQEAVDNSQFNDTVRVSGYCWGVHSVNLGGQVLSQTVHITQPITLQGGWNSDFDQLAPHVYTTTLDAQGMGRAVLVSGATAVVENFQIINGQAAAAGGPNAGGGIYLLDASATLRGNWVHANRAAQGGGLFSSGGNPVVERNRIYDNQATADGGAMYHSDGNLMLRNNFIYSNTATSGDGGGLHNAALSATVLHNTFYANQAGDGGGGVYNASAGTPSIRSNIFANNLASNGGAVYDAGDVFFDYNDVWVNSANQTWSEAHSAPLPAANNISADPQFLGVGTADFHLSAASALIDAADPATSLAEVNGDFDGDPRPSNQGFDIGADEQAGCYASIPPYDAAHVYGSLQLAVDLVSPRNTVRVAGVCQGVHPLAVGPTTLRQTVHLTKNVRLQGGWTWNPNTRTLVNYNSNNLATLDALQLGRVLLITNSAVVTVENFNLRYGDAAGLGGGPGDQAAGGGVYNYDGDLTLRNSRLFSNTAQTGGALYNAGGSLTLQDNSLYSNQAAQGAALYLAGGSQTVAHNSVYSNTAGANGGGVYIGGGSAVALSANTFRENVAGNGAAIYNDNTSANVAVYNNVVYRNQAALGGGFYNAAGSPFLQHNTFYGNQSATNGGGLYSAAGSPVISNSLVISNTNGGLYVAGGSPAVAYSDFYGNSASNYVGIPDQTGSNGNISEDPLFVDAAAGDFHLTTLSPAMDRGDPRTTLAVDFEDDIRPGSQGFDMGADEISTCFARTSRLPGTIFGNPQAAVDASQSGDTVDVSGACYGVHSIDAGGPISQTLHVTKTLTLRGGWRVTADDPFAEHDPGLFTTILDAQGGGRVLYIDGGLSVEPAISGFDLRHGNAVLPGMGNGGGIYNNSNATLSNLSVYSNTAINGGGFYNAGGAPTLDADDGGANYVYANSAVDGAGLYLADGTPRVWNAIVRDNTASGDGGGFYLADAGLATVLNNTIYQNHATDQGGGMYIAGGSHDVRDLIVAGNSATNANGGGGVYVAGGSGSPNLAYNDVWNNAPGGNYGGVGGDRTGSNGNISANPLFADGAFHLSIDSPALDAGDPAATLPEGDFEGTIRPSHQRFDMGADEFGGCLARNGSVLYGSVQRAVDLASTGDTVEVAGRCLGVHPLDLGGGQVVSQTVHLAKSITLEGGWQLEDPPFGTNDHAEYPTYLDATGAGRVLYIYAGAAPNIQKINLVNGDANGLGGGSSGEDAGGCVYIASGLPDFSGGVNIHDCRAGQGGGIYNVSSDFTLHNTGIYSNSAQMGAGVYSAGGSPEMQNLLYLHNLAETDGGAVYVAGGSPQMWHLTLVGNVADNNGGAIYNASSSDPLIRSSIFYANIATNQGGGFFEDGSALVDYSDWYLNIASITSTADSNVNVLAGTGSLSLDPQFDPAPDRVFALSESSPLIDAAAPISPPVALDFELDLRPQINGYDMGWDEVPERVGFSFTPSHTGNQSLRADPCDVFTVTHTLRNLGNIADTYTVTLQSDTPSWGNVLLPDDPLIVPLDGGQSAQVYFRISVPCDALGGAENVSVLRATSDHSGNSRTVTDRTLVNSLHAIEIAPTNYGAAAPGQTITYTHIVTNSGNVTDTFGVTLSPDYSLPLATPTSIQLGPGTTATLTVSVTIEGWAAGGLTDIVDVVAYWLGNPAIQASVANHTSISYTTGTRYVAVDGHDDEDPDIGNIKTNNCTDPVHGPCRTIQHAINQAWPGDEVWIGGGVYSDVVTASVGSEIIEQVIYLDKSVTLRGGYYAGDWAQPPDPFTHTTTLDGQDARRVIYVPAGYTPTLQYLALTGGSAEAGGATGQLGGGLYNAGSNLTLLANAVHHNRAPQDGGGLYSAAGNLLLQNNTLYRNRAGEGGGGLYVGTGSASLENNTFNANQATNGAGIYNAASMVLTNTVLADNMILSESGGSGGAIYNSGAITLAYNNIVFNSAPEFIGMPDPIGTNGNVAVDPYFVDANSDDYHLFLTSPMIDAGTPVVATREDFEGDARPQAGGYDIGADERVPARGLLFYDDEEFTTTAPDTVVFTHTLVNTGDITDTFSLTYSSTYPWLTTFEQPMPYTLTLGAGASYSVPVTIQVPPGANGQINTTIITATSSLTSVSANVIDTIYVRSAEWEISKRVTPAHTVRPGEYLTYTLTITNSGDLPTSGVYTITDMVPAHTNFVRATPSPVPTSPTVTWVDEAPLAEGESITRTYVVQVTEPLTDGTEIVNDVYSVVGGDAYNQAWGAPVTVTVEAPAVLSVAKTASHDPVRPGDWLTYTLTISNDAAAPGPALGVIISDTLPADVVYQAMGFVPPAGGVFTATASPLLVWQLANPIPPGGRSQVTATVRVTSPLAASTLLANTYAVTADNLPAQVSGTTTTAVTSSNSISLYKTVTPAFVARGGTVTYTITLTNSGDGLTTAALTDVLHPDFSPNSYSANVLVPGRTWSTDAGATTTTFTATAPLAAGVYYNQWITATYDLAPAVTISHTAPVSVVAPMLVVSKESAPNPVPAGTALTYTLYVTNTGQVTLTNVVVTDTLPAQVTPGGALTWTPGIIIPDAVWTQTVVVDVEAGYTGTLTNVIQATTGEGATGIFTQTTPVFNAAIAVGKETNVAAASVGQTITYTYRVTNTGSVTLTNISAEDDRLGATSLLTTTLAPGASTSGTATYLVQESDLPGPLANTVLVTGSGTLPFAAVVTGTAGASVDLTFNAAIAIAKTPDSQVAAGGAPVTFTIAITNVGDVTLAPVMVTDVLAPDCGNEPQPIGPPPLPLVVSQAPPIPTLEAGNSISYTCTSLAGSDDFTNTAIVTGTLPGGGTVTDSDTAFVHVLQPAIQIAKTPDRQAVASDGAALFTLAVTNTGEVTLMDVAVSDVLVSDCSRTLGELAPGGSGSYNCAATHVLTDFINTALVAGTSPSGAVVTAVDTATVIVEEAISGLIAINDSPTLLGNSTTLTASVAVGGNVIYTWAFGDGTGGSGPLLSHGYPSVGVFTAVVTASNSVSELTATTIVTITDVPVTGLAATNDSPTTLGSPTSLTATITAGSNVTYTWAFGDGTGGSGALVTHTYPAPGTYTATITASNSAGQLTATTLVAIVEAPSGGRIYLPLILKNFTPPPPPPPRPDLVVANIELIPISGSSYTVQVTACNQSSTPVTFGNNFYVNAYFSGDYGTPIIIWGVQASWFGADQCVMLESDYAFSNSGTLRAWADAYNTVVEANEDNNTRDIDVNLSRLGSGVPLQGSQLLPSGPQPTPTNVP
jgi:uncharacterized repeat protein (TIGR01451 family)